MSDTKKGAEKAQGELLPGGVSQEQFQKWKNVHGDVHEIIAGKKNDKTGKTYHAYLKNPDRKTMSAAMSFVSKDPVKMNEILLENCWLGGDEEIKTDDGLFFAAAAVISEVFNIGEAEVKKH